MQKQTKSSTVLFIVILCLASIRFFNPVIASDKSLNIFNYIYVLLLAFVVPSYFKAINSFRKTTFSYPVKMLIVAVFISILTAYFFHSQGIAHGIFGSLFGGLGYMSYFYFAQEKVTLKDLEKVVVSLGVIFTIAFAIAFTVYPNKIFDYQDFEDDRGFQRIIIAGTGFLFLAFFLSINKYQRTKKKIWILASVIFFACIVLTLERLYILTSILIAILYLLRRQKTYMKVLAVAVLASIVIILPQLDVYNTLIEKTADDLSVGQDYVRFRAAGFFLTEFQPSVVTQILGNGFAYEKSPYGQQMINVHNNQFWIEDLGFIGLYIYLGVLAILAYIIVFSKSIRLRVDEDARYPKLFLYFILCNGLTSSATYNEGFLYSVILALALFDKSKNLASQRISQQPD